ncbi:MAG: hypothetical protein GTO53_01325 [Planctomycetales bacterium]|nr:hypothetical protein [Planctomycetales bacterium]NIM07813.1 hypothetical protein [Planctomycetales bacterium]NIN07305.1 hypothetical protein [Planctomycetales bacterium]NIN76408.1 hypothetical protein [Planctomycetales bacterium]NIO33606.1 hypothetical protein [Planctomycetales bacterium]
MSRSITFLMLLWIPTWASAVEVHFAHLEDPRLDPPTVIQVFPERLKPLWLQALATDEADLQREAARAIARAHRQGMKGLEETVPSLRTLLDSPKLHPVVCREVARTLIVLDARDAAQQLMQLALQGGLDLALEIEPALARWDHQPMRQVWLDRLTAPDTSHARRILAIDGLGEIRQQGAGEPLRQIVLDSLRSADQRLHAASALARIKTDGSLEDADRLAQGTRIDRLAAARLLAEHQGADLQTLLLRLAVDTEPAVGAIALERLMQLDPFSIEPIVDRLVSSPDARIRQLTAQMLFQQGSPEGVRRLGGMLADVNPNLRLWARESLIQLDRQPQLAAAIRQAAMKALHGDHPLALHQAIILVGAIDHEPAAERLLKLLDAKDPPLRVVAAWSLRKLAVPATAEAIQKKIRQAIQVTNALAKQYQRGPPYDVSDHTLPAQVAHLLEALGEIQDRSARLLFAEFLPRPPEPDPFGPPVVQVVRLPQPRAAALWALAACYADQPDPQVVEAVSHLFSDALEEEDLRAVAAIGLGRLKSKSSLSLLRSKFHPDDRYSHLGHACSWALQQITGKDPHVWKPRLIARQDWFLQPLP